MQTRTLLRRALCEGSSFRRALLLAFLLIPARPGVAQHNPATDPPAPCDFKAAEIPGKEFRLDKSQDKLNGEGVWLRETTKRLDEVLQIVKDTWPGQKGFEADYYRVLAKNPSESVAAYHLAATMYTYRCVNSLDRATGKYVYSGEIIKPNLDSMVDTGVKAFYVHVGINSRQKLFQKELHAHVDGHERAIVQTFPLVTEIDGFKIYGVDRLGGNKVMFSGRPGESIYTPLSRKGYVLATMESMDEYYGPSGHPGTGTYRGSFPVENVEAERADMKRFLETTPEEELNKPAYTTGIIGYWAGPSRDGKPVRYFEETLRPGLSEVMVQRTDYYRKDVPNYIPQMFVLGWEMASVTEVGRMLEQRFLANFPARRLEAMLDK